MNNEQKKYDLVEGQMTDMWRIKALIDIPRHGVKAGDLGGYVDNFTDFSQEGDCWIDSNSTVQNSRITGDAFIRRSTVERSDITDCCSVINSNIADCCLRGGSVIRDSSITDDNYSRSSITIDEAWSIDNAVIDHDEDFLVVELSLSGPRSPQTFKMFLYTDAKDNIHVRSVLYNGELWVMEMQFENPPLSGYRESFIKQKAKIYEHFDQQPQPKDITMDKDTERLNDFVQRLKKFQASYQNQQFPAGALKHLTSMVKMTFFESVPDFIYEQDNPHRFYALYSYLYPDETDRSVNIGLDPVFTMFIIGHTYFYFGPTVAINQDGLIAGSEFIQTRKVYPYELETMKNMTLDQFVALIELIQSNEHEREVLLEHWRQAVTAFLIENSERVNRTAGRNMFDSSSDLCADR